MSVVNIYSKIEKNKLLHKIIKKSLFDETSRLDVIEDDNFLQLAVLKMDEGKTFAPHKHIYKDFNDKTIAQESWVVIRGSVKVIYYDLDDSIIHEDMIEQGDCSITLFGGHNYEVLEDNTQVYEFKTGPYLGQKLDKEFIE